MVANNGNNVNTNTNTNINNGNINNGNINSNNNNGNIFINTGSCNGPNACSVQRVRPSKFLTMFSLSWCLCSVTVLMHGMGPAFCTLSAAGYATMTCQHWV